MKSYWKRYHVEGLYYVVDEYNGNLPPVPHYRIHVKVSENYDPIPIGSAYNSEERAKEIIRSGKVKYI